MKLKPHQQKLIYGGFALAVLVAGVFVYLSQNNKQSDSVANGKSGSENQARKENAVHFKHDTTGLELDYDKTTVTAGVLSNEDMEDKIILRLTERQGDNKPFLITVRYETGLAKAAAITKLDLIDHLANSASLTLPKRQAYKLISHDRIIINQGNIKTDALRYLFTYIANEEVTAKQQLVIIPIGSDMAVYVALQAIETDYSELDQQIFRPLMDSLALINREEQLLD